MLYELPLASFDNGCAERTFVGREIALKNFNIRYGNIRDYANSLLLGDVLAKLGQGIDHVFDSGHNRPHEAQPLESSIDNNSGMFHTIVKLIFWEEGTFPVLRKFFRGGRIPTVTRGVE
jgi:hypothetical protein